jgi:uncharacterized protein (TIGR03437 family)
MSIFGSGLARSEHALVDDDLIACTAGRCLPTEMNYVRVYVQDQPVPLLYVSATQINFLMSSLQAAGPVRVRVVTETNSGPEVTVTVVDAAPALFPNPLASGYAIATSADGTLLTPDAPAHANDIVVLYLTGLGRTSQNPVAGEIPAHADQMVPATLATLKVTLNGVAVDGSLIKYAGVTPGCAGLYQINLYLTGGTGDDPEIQVTAGNLAPPTILKLPLR